MLIGFFDVVRVELQRVDNVVPVGRHTSLDCDLEISTSL